ncbi:MAG: hypothetical protein JWQ94_3528, partial [Tardiphaga sp.]|nr:hypothetical protein [Tardiphaga sp.]
MAGIAAAANWTKARDWSRAVRRCAGALALAVALAGGALPAQAQAGRG